MRKIDLSPYNIRRQLQHDTLCPKCGTTLPKDALVPGQYAVQDSLVELCFVPAEGCKGRELLLRQQLAEKMAAAKGKILLEEADWNRFVKALDSMPGMGRNEVELVRRILDAPNVIMEEKKPAKRPG